MTRAPSCERSSGGTSPRRRTDSSAMPSLTCSARQRRVTTGGPIRTANAPCSLRWRDHRVEPGPEVVAGPVDDRPLGQVGEVALDPGQLAVEDQRRADDLGAAEPADGLGAPLGLHLRPAGRLEEAGGRPASDEVAVLLGGDRAQRQGGRHLGKATRDQTRPPYVSGPLRLQTPGARVRLRGRIELSSTRFVRPAQGALSEAPEDRQETVHRAQVARCASGRTTSGAARRFRSRGSDGPSGTRSSVLPSSTAHHRAALTLGDTSMNSIDHHRLAPTTRARRPASASEPLPAPRSPTPPARQGNNGTVKVAPDGDIDSIPNNHPSRRLHASSSSGTASTGANVVSTVALRGAGTDHRRRHDRSAASTGHRPARRRPRSRGRRRRDRRVAGLHPRPSPVRRTRSRATT